MLLVVKLSSCRRVLCCGCWELVEVVHHSAAGLFHVVVCRLRFRPCVVLVGFGTVYALAFSKCSGDDDDVLMMIRPLAFLHPSLHDELSISARNAVLASLFMVTSEHCL